MSRLCLRCLPSPAETPGAPRGLARGALQAGGHSVCTAEGRAASSWRSKAIRSPPHDFQSTDTPLTQHPS